jgi:phenylpropionate dioxygenase-like ring-hydroxylating dioxygenase large terminal subunit
MSAQPAKYQLPSNEDVAGLGTDPIPAAPYYRPEYFELEREAIFKRTWLQIGHILELPEPGSFIVRPLEFANASILIIRGKDGKIRAFHNVCTHRGTQLVEDLCGVRSSFTCRYHAWTFDTEGNLRGAPDFERFYVEQAQCNLRPVAVDVCAGLIFVNLDKSPAQSLRDYLGPLAERLETLAIAQATTISEYVYEIDANWKLTYDNFQENYHLRFIHPQTIGITLADQNAFGYPTKFEYHGPHRTQSIWFNQEFVPPPVQGLAFANLAGWAAADGTLMGPYASDYFALFPNFFLLGNPMQHFSHVVMPISANRSRGVIRLYWIGLDDSATKRFARELAMALARDIHAEDRAVIEAGQRGLSSGALEHIHFQSQEALCRHFILSVDSAVQAHKARRETLRSIA